MSKGVQGGDTLKSAYFQSREAELDVRAHFGNANAAMGRLSLTTHVFHSECHMRKHKGIGFDVLADKVPCSR